MFRSSIQSDFSVRDRPITLLDLYVRCLDAYGGDRLVLQRFFQL